MSRFNFTEFPGWAMQITAFLPTAIILPLGLLSNVCAIAGLILHLQTQAKNLIYYLIGSLMLYDLALLVLYWPIELIKKSIAWPLGAFLCYLFNIFPIFCNSGPSFIMIAMIVDRYRVLVHQANPNPTPCRKAIILTVIAISAFGLAFPDIVFTAYQHAYIILIGSDYFPLKPAIGCFIYFFSRLGAITAWRVYYISLYLFIYILPLIIVLVLFYVTKSKLARSPLNDSTTVDSEPDTKFLYMTLYLMTVFVIFWSAEYIFFIIYHYNIYLINIKAYRRYQFIYLLVQHFTLCKTIVNPFIYAHFIPEIKQVLSHVFICGYSRKLRPSRSQGQSDTIILTATQA